MNKLWLVLPFFIFILVACQSGVKEAEEQELVEMTGGNSDFIRNEITADDNADTVNVAKIAFETPTYDFGEIEEGERVQYSFKFKNTGKKPLIIKSATATCGCTIPKPSKTPIAPGKIGEIPVTFNSSGKGPTVTKTITVVSNAYPNTTEVKLVGIVNKKK